jgi:undecaprenyl-phosphate 4-deoxy-4-formamido-L-arabinose transferase
MLQETIQKPRVSFVVPLFNTGRSLPFLIEAFRELEVKGGWELILVDDGSTDGTARRAAQLVKGLENRVTLVELARNFGEHAAVLEGFRRSRGEFVVNLDDDLQNPLSEALKLLDHLQKTGADVVYSYYEEKKHAWWRNAGSRGLNWIATVLLDKPKDLYLSSFRAMRRELVDRVVQYRGPYPYIDGLILGATNRIERFKVEHAERAEGRSSYTFRKLVRLSLNMLFDFSIMPLRVASVLGGFLCAVGLAMLLRVLLEAVVAGRVQPGWGSLMAVITVFSGAQLLMLGLIGEYVGRAFLTVSGKPQCWVRAISIKEPSHDTARIHHQLLLGTRGASV